MLKSLPSTENVAQSPDSLNIQDDGQTSARQRVTPEELAKALAAIEARKEQSERDAAGTIPIGEAVQQLGFDSSADEIWNEVQTQRQQNHWQTQTRLPRKTRRALIAGVCVAGLVLAGIGLHMQPSDNESQNVSDVPTQQIIMPQSPQTVIKTLAEIPNNGSFYCDEATAQKILSRTAPTPAQVLVTNGIPATGQQQSVSWTFTNHAGKIYVHGFTTPRSPAAMRVGPIDISNIDIDNTGAGGTNDNQSVALAVGTFHIDSIGAAGINNIMTVSGIHPDSHFRDSQ
jgi:hypothetical protein